MAELREYREVSSVAAVLHQLTAPRTIKAVLVLSFATVACVQVLQGIPVDEVIKSGLLLILGYYFGDEGNDAPPAETVTIAPFPPKVEGGLPLTKEI